MPIAKRAEVSIPSYPTEMQVKHACSRYAKTLRCTVVEHVLDIAGQLNLTEKGIRGMLENGSSDSGTHLTEKCIQGMLEHGTTDSDTHLTE